MKVLFKIFATGTIVTKQFQPKQENSFEMQQSGRQMILDNFKKCVS
jgi:hypothetical protein